MHDVEIIELLLRRDEKALFAAEEKYKSYCVAVAERILGSREDAEECWNDALSGLWNSVPPNEPQNLKLYLGKIARNTALKKLDAEKAKKVLAEGRQDYPTIADYLASIDKLSYQGDCVTYDEDGTVHLKYKN